MEKQEPEQQITHALPQKSGISRRSFLKGAAALVTMGFCEYLPSVDGGCLFPVYDALAPTPAYAETIIHDQQPYTFTVVSPEEVGIRVLDTAQNPPVPVADAEVTLTSRYNGNSITLNTDDEGKVIMSIVDLSVDDDGDADVGQRLYHFNGTLTVKSPNSRIHRMRDFSTGLLYVEGASGLDVYTHALDGMEAYPERITFDEWDAHYTVNTFFRSKSNEDDHELLVRLANAAAGVDVALKNLTTPDWPKGGDGYVAQTDFDPGTGLACVRFKAPFLKTGDPACLAEEESTLRISYSYGGKDYASDVTLKVLDAPLERAEPSSLLFPLSRSSSGISVSWPTKAPFFSKLSFSVWTPRIPVTVQFTPTNLLLGIGCDAILADTDSGMQDVNGWRKNPVDYFTTKYKKAVNKKLMEMQSILALKGFINEKAGEFDRHMFSKNLEMNVALEAVLNLDWQGMETIKGIHYKTFRGKLSAGIDLSLNLTFTEQFMAGPVPFFVSLSFALFSQLALVLAASVNTPEDNYELPLDKCAFSLDTFDPIVINLNFSVTLSAGIGVDGVVALTISGSPSLSLYLGLLTDVALTSGDEVEASDGNKTWPHIIAGYAFKAEIMFQVVVFKFSATIWSTSDDHWYDNWPKEDTLRSGADLWREGEARFMFTQEDGTVRHSAVYGGVDELLQGIQSYDGFALVTDAELGKSKEFEGNPSVAADQVSGTVPTVYADRMVWPVRGEDGSVSMELVYCEGACAFVFDDESGAQGVVLDGMSDVGRTDADLLGGEQLDTEQQYAEQADADQPSAELPEEVRQRIDGLSARAASLARSSVPEYDYTYVGHIPERDGEPGVIGIAPHGGIAVSDVKTAENVFSDPRHRYAHIEGVTYLFRILTVGYGRAGGETVHRTRLSVSAYDEDAGSWGVPRVLEYGSDDPDLPRVDIFDYDFDIAVKPADTTWPKGASACVVVSGGMRPYGDQSKICDVFANPTLTVLFLDGSMNVVLRRVQRVGDVYEDDLAHMVTCPRVVDGFGLGKHSGVLAASFIHRCVDKGDVENIMTAPATFPVAVVSVAQDKASLVVHTGGGGEYELDPSVQSLDLVLGDPVEGQYDALLTFLFRSQGGYDVYSARIPYQGVLSQMIVERNVHSTSTLPGAQPWQGHGSFLLTHPSTADQVDPHLYEGTYEVGVTDASALTETIVDLEGFGGGAFGLSPTGSYLFYIDTRKGEGGFVDVDPQTGEPIKAEDDIFRIKASKYIDGAFCPQFDFCELSHEIDSLVPISFDSLESSFVASRIVDPDASTADLYFITVPHSMVAEVQDFRLIDNFACAGHPCAFQVTIHNHGNIVISGFDLQMCDVDNNYAVVSEVHVGKIKPESVLLTAFNCADPRVRAGLEPLSEEGFRMRDSLASGQLMPGAPLAYAVDFDIPADWAGEKTVCVRMANAWASETDVSAVGGEVYRHFKEAEGTITVPAVVTTGTGMPDDPHEEWTERGSGDDQGGGSGTGGGGSAAGGRSGAFGTSGVRLPQTGDPLAGTGALALGLGTLGAGLAAYSRRRQQVEREEKKTS